MSDLADIIKGIPIFSGLSGEEIAKILGKLEETALPEATTIFSQGEEGDAFYLIQSGSVQVLVETAGGGSECVAVLGAQNWFGEMALLSGEPRSATIVTLQPTTVWQLSRDNWNELIALHPSWLNQICIVLSKRLADLDRQYSQGRVAFNSLAEEFYNSRSAEEQSLLRQLALLRHIELKSLPAVAELNGAVEFLSRVNQERSPLMQNSDAGALEFHNFFKDFLKEKYLEIEGPEQLLAAHNKLGQGYQANGQIESALHHSLEGRAWPKALELIENHKESLSNSAPALIGNALQRIPLEVVQSNLRWVQLQADNLLKIGDLPGAMAVYQAVLTRRQGMGEQSEAIERCRVTAANLAKKKDYAQALAYLRSAVALLYNEQSGSGMDSTIEGASGTVTMPSLPGELSIPTQRPRTLVGDFSSVRDFFGSRRGLGGVGGFLLWAYLWFGKPDIGLDPSSTQLLGLLGLTLIYWVFRVFPDYGVALLFALVTMLSGMGTAELVFGGFGSKTWFTTLGVLGLGAAITGSGLFYRLSLQLVRVFPLNYRWQVIALGLMGIVVMALIPQQSARTAIISQMLSNLSESLGYKNPSKASTGLFAASFLGLGQLGFLFLTGSTTSLIAWGLLPSEVQAQFTWGFWFIAAMPPTLVVTVIVLGAALFVFKPETEGQISYKMVQTQLEILGPMSRREWITLVVLCLTVGGWVTGSYHGLDGAWVALIALCILINTGGLGWGGLKTGVDWELLIYMGATLNIPILLTHAGIDKWLVEVFSPLILPFLDSPAIAFLLIALITYAVKLMFTSFLTVVTLCVALLPLAADLNINPWVMIMIVLIASEVWFFRFQVDWHSLAFATTDGKGFSYPFMARINMVYAGAYLVALLVAIPYWRYLGLMQ